MMPPVSLPLNGGTVSARAGAQASIPHTATKLAAPIIRIADSISLAATLKRIARHEKNGGGFAAELSAGVAALHLTAFRLRGTVRASDHPADCPCPSSSHREQTRSRKIRTCRRARRGAGPAGVRAGRRGGQSIRNEFLAVRPT